MSWDDERLIGEMFLASHWNELISEIKRKSSSIWDKSVVAQHLLNGFAFRNEYQYFYGDDIFDTSKKGSWNIPLLEASKGGGFIEDSNLIYSTSTAIRNATLNADYTTTTEDLIIPTFPTNSSIFVRKSDKKIFINNNAGLTVSSITTTASTLTATYNNTTKILRYDVTSGIDIDFTIDASVGDSIDITGSTDPLNNTTRIVTAVGFNYIEFDASQGWGLITEDITLNYGDFTLSIDELIYNQIIGSGTPSPTIKSYNATLNNVVSGDRITIRYYSSLSINTVDTSTSIGNSGAVYSTFNQEITTQSGGVVIGGRFYIEDNLQGGSVTSPIIHERLENSAISESPITSISMVVGGAEDRIIRAYDLVGSTLTADNSSDIFLPIELSDYCDQFSVLDDSTVLINKSTGENAIYNSDTSIELINKTTPTLPNMAFIQSLQKSKLVSNVGSVYNVFEFPI